MRYLKIGEIKLSKYCPVQRLPIVRSSSVVPSVWSTYWINLTLILNYSSSNIHSVFFSFDLNPISILRSFQRLVVDRFDVGWSFEIFILHSHRLSNIFTRPVNTLQEYSCKKWSAPRTFKVKVCRYIVLHSIYTIFVWNTKRILGQKLFQNQQNI